MEDNTALFTTQGDSNITSDLLGNDKPLLDMKDFENLEPCNVTKDIKNENTVGQDLLDDFTGIMQSGLVSTTRPLSTSREDIIVDDGNISPSLPTSNLSEFEIADKHSSNKDSEADTRVEDTFRDPSPDLKQPSVDDRLLIDQDSHHAGETELISSARAGSNSPVSSDKVLESEIAEPLPKVKDPKIGSQAKAESDNYEFENCAYETAAQPAVKREVAMEAETVGNASKNSETECPFSAGIIHFY